jgi:hypothetical protein
VLAGAGLTLITARHQLGEVATVAAWALMATLAGAVIAAGVYEFLWLRHRSRNPNLLAARGAVPAQPGATALTWTAQQVPAGTAAVIEPGREVHLHLSVTSGQLAAIMQHHTEEDQ